MEDNKTITMEFDFTPFKKLVTDILINEVRQHVYCSRDNYTKFYDVKGTINKIYEEIDLEEIRKEVKDKVQHTIAEVIFNKINVEIGNDVKAIMSNSKIRDEYKYQLRKMTEELLSKLDEK